MLTQTFDIEQRNKLVLVRVVATQLIGSASQDLFDTLSQKLRTDGAVYFVIDMSKVQFVSSACLGPLVTFLQDLECLRGRMAFAACRPNIQLLLKMTRLDSILRMYDDMSEACEDISHG